ncbi:hypothetical protein BDP27DRAFT_1231936 [Rhodocollybia butyracea]|uniref:Uncharacterized protein n=1 Tax=Rhodocollybia butyracea TaxID=206335 RepID=A0A9P5PJ35_9AGAR|nr:hypothetical protein BDP27DRAFT_1231936 [Rhodocollybia butyracea]
MTLPADCKGATKSKLLQGSLDSVVVPVECTKAVIPYTDANFECAAFEWLIATNQPIWALQQEHYHTMIEIASRATDGVKIPSRKLTRQ